VKEDSVRREEWIRKGKIYKGNRRGRRDGEGGERVGDTGRERMEIEGKKMRAY
jgi:hypothetical protein